MYCECKVNAGVVHNAGVKSGLKKTLTAALLEAHVINNRR